MLIDSRHARVFGATLTQVHAEINDMRAEHPVLKIDGEATGSADDFLRFVAESPIADWMEHATDGAVTSGPGRLTLKLELPLGKPDANKIAGEYTFAGNRLKLQGDLPALSQLNGKLQFTEREVHANPLTAEILGGPARIVIASDHLAMLVNAQGSANLGQLRVEYPREPLAARFSGTTDWQMAMTWRDQLSTWAVDSSLKGATIDLPAPAQKAAGDSVPLKVERLQSETGHDTIAISYGQLGRLTVHRALTATGAVPERALLALGKAEGDADRRGLWIRGDVAALNLDGWLALRAEAAAVGSDDMILSGIDLRIGTLDIFGRRLNDLRVDASRGGSDWQLDLSGRELEGNARWEVPVPSRPNGRIVARLRRLSAPTAGPDAPVVDAAAVKLDSAPENNAWPELDVVADSFLQKGRDLGSLEVLARPHGSDWQIEHLLLANEDGRIEAQGQWRATGRTQQTRLDIKLDISDAGKYLTRFGMPEGVRGAPTKIAGQLSWAGSPQDFDYPTLTGSFRVDTGRGQFTKLDPGLGKLLGVLSLQSLQRRLTFDFQDVFGEGFAFDEITGDVQIRNGVMRSDNLKIVGPAARIDLSGETDISRETQKLTVRVQPTLSASVSVGAAALMIANPIVGAVIGAGSLLAQKVLKDPIEQLFSYEYNITGSWSNPIVERPGAATAAVPAANLTR